MKKIMICGSRDATLEMIEYAYRCVEQAAHKNYIILVGDAQGIDHAVVEACTRLNVVCICAGIAARPRNGGCTNLRSTYINQGIMSNGGKEKRVTFASYTERDEYLVRCVTDVVCVWNGISPGTHHVYEYALKLEKRVKLKTFERILI